MALKTTEDWLSLDKQLMDAALRKFRKHPSATNYLRVQGLMVQYQTTWFVIEENKNEKMVAKGMASLERASQE